MNNSIFIIFFAFGIIWILMAIATVIFLLKSDGQEIRFGKMGLIVVIPIIVPIIITLAYAAFRGTF
ncbi:hypothetical protein Cylst_6234 [Cylindrospermum stagnale PCC 7417]|uniref:Uncharacterized protein n=1 Tax=Cylindrospermum stagnale PCC 7417 TaxID=56107 RepID=K9X7V7_9NOST|nr:hypothetical protein Cylst_6234 [Cylindrospermum stagnale PCC 7417]